jgi:L,D-transpeptidase catalytic domain
MSLRLPPVALLGALVLAIAGQTALSAPAAIPVPSAVPAAHRAVVAARRRQRAGSFLVARVRRPVGRHATPGGRTVARIGPRTEFGSPRVLAVARREGPWLGVVATELPNGRLGWIRARRGAIGLGWVTTSLHADLSSRTVELRARGRAVATVKVAVGRAGSTTPTGRFAVTDELQGSSFGPYYGCCILALSAHQPSPPSGWRGGNRLAIHGTSAPGTIGAAASAGCLRAADGDLERLMRRVPTGTPVFIHA